jgi:hypothetical protein
MPPTSSRLTAARREKIPQFRASSVVKYRHRRSPRPAPVCELALATRAMPNEPNRLENRTPLRVAVDLAALEVRTPAQQGVTENVSLHGARIITGRPLPLNERLNIRSLVGNLRSRARVVYCEPRPTGDFVVGLQLTATVGDWTFPQQQRRATQ